MANATIIDGRELAKSVKDSLAQRVIKLQTEGKKVRLDAVLVGADQGAHLYAKNQAKACCAVGIEYMLHELPESASHRDVADTVAGLNTNSEVTAIMVHVE